MDSFKLLILAGGHSSRMGFPKHLLPVPPTDQPLYQHLIRTMYVAFPETQTVHLSVADASKTDDALERGELFLPTKGGASRVELVKIRDKTTQDIGPSAGLLGAHQYDPSASWLVVACDFPLLDPAALHQLQEAYESPVTSFVNKDGFSEPLLAIWSPQALRALSKNVENGCSGPTYTIKSLESKLILPINNDWILNTNTPEEWEDTKWRIKNPQSVGRV